MSKCGIISRKELSTEIASGKRRGRYDIGVMGLNTKYLNSGLLYINKTKKEKRQSIC